MVRNIGTSLIACLLATRLLAAETPAYDDGITEPYVPPEEHSDYVSELSPELASTIYADPAHIEQWQDDKFGVFMHWDPSCQMTGAVSWSRLGRRPHHPSDGTVTQGIPAETYDNLYKTFNPVKFDADNVVHEFDTIIALELDKPAMGIPVIPSVGKNLTIGAVASASSQGSDATPASAVIASDAVEFHEGTFIRSVWAPSREDEAPWLEIAFGDPKPVSQIQIQEGRYGADSTIEAFTISLRVNGRWETVYSGNGIGNTFGLVLEEALLADAMRIDFTQWQRKININMVNAY